MKKINLSSDDIKIIEMKFSKLYDYIACLKDEEAITDATHQSIWDTLYCIQRYIDV